MKSLLILLTTIAVLSVITIAIIAYGRGFRFNPQDREVAATGLLNATSDPDGAQVYVDGTLKTATNSTLNLLPGTYQVKINKEGYLPWEKQMTIFKEVVAQTETFLFPANPGLSPLTISGVENPTVSPDGASIAFIRHNHEGTPSSALTESPISLPRRQAGNLQSPTLAPYRSTATGTGSDFGIFVLDLTDRPLSFSRKPRKIASSDDFGIWNLEFGISLIWSPDSKEILAIVGRTKSSDEVKDLVLTEDSAAYLLDASRSNLQPQLVASPAEILKLWQEQRELETQSKIASLPNKLIPLFANETPAETTPGVKTSGVSPASPAGGRSGSPDVESHQSLSVKRTAELISFSPDESKILYQATQETTIPQIIKPPLNGVNPTQEQRTIEPNNIYVYDLKEDRNYLLPQMVDRRPSTVDQAAPQAQLNWFPTSRHLFFVEEGPSTDSTSSPQASSGQAKIKVMEYDGANETTVYAGPFEPDFVVPWPNGSNLVILTTLNPDAAETLNLYAVKLR